MSGSRPYNRALMNALHRTLSARFTFAVIAVLTSHTLTAHHSFAMYDKSITYVFTGVVERINPDGAHLQIIFVPRPRAAVGHA